MTAREIGARLRIAIPNTGSAAMPPERGARS
jgi:hypothetical protein